MLIALVVRNCTEYATSRIRSLAFVVYIEPVAMVRAVPSLHEVSAKLKMPGAAEMQRANGVVNNDGAGADAAPEAGHTHAAKQRPRVREAMTQHQAGAQIDTGRAGIGRACRRGFAPPYRLATPHPHSVSDASAVRFEMDVPVATAPNCHGYVRRHR